MVTIDPLETAKNLSPLVEACADETERTATMAASVVEAIESAGLFQLMVPADLGGGNAEISTLVEVVEELSRADASTGWSYMANAASTAIVSGFCGDGAVEEIFGGGKLGITGGMFGPAGTIKVVDGGYRLTGRYSFGSGALHATWIGAGGIPEGGGLEDALVCVFPADRAEILGNWDVLGLIGTGSVDYRVDDLFVPEEFTFRRLALGARRGQASLQLGLLPTGIAGHMGVAFGTAKRALAEMVGIVDEGRQRPGMPPLADQPHFLHEFAVNEGRYRASRAYGMEALHQALETVDSGDPVTDLHLQRIRHATSLAVAAALDVVTFAYTWSGSAGLRNPHPLGRLMRDMHGQTQHILVDENARILAAPALMEAYR